MGFFAVLAGWVTTEVGRQPFTVYGLLRTSDSLAPISAPAVATSLNSLHYCNTFLSLVLELFICYG